MRNNVSYYSYQYVRLICNNKIPLIIDNHNTRFAYKFSYDRILTITLFSAMKLKGIKCWNIFFNLLCVLGCFYQLSNIGLSFFKYETVSKNSFLTPQVLDFHVLHFCFVYLTDAIDWTAIEKKYGSKYPFKTFEHKLKWMDVLTVADVLNFTPDLDIKGCSYRTKIGNSINHRHDCNMFDIEKYISQQYICFRMSPKVEAAAEFYFVHTSLLYDRLMYEVRFNGKLSKSNKIRPILTDDEFPYISRGYAPGFYKRRDDDISMMISCQNYSVFLLGYPYDFFKCGEGYSDFPCMDQCIENKTLTGLGRLPYAWYYDEPNNHKIVSQSMIQNETIWELINKWSNECGEICTTYPCVYSYCITVGHVDPNIDVDGDTQGITIRVESPSNPDTRTKYVPMVTFLDLIIYVMSTLGTWFGLVVISCNPIVILGVLYDRFKSKMTGIHEQNVVHHRPNLRIRKVIVIRSNGGRE